MIAEKIPGEKSHLHRVQLSCTPCRWYLVTRWTRNTDKLSTFQSAVWQKSQARERAQQNQDCRRNKRLSLLVTQPTRSTVSEHIVTTDGLFSSTTGPRLDLTINLWRLRASQMFKQTNKAAQVVTPDETYISDLSPNSLTHPTCCREAKCPRCEGFFSFFQP